MSYSPQVTKSRTQPSNFTSHAPITNAKEAEVDQFYEDLEDLLELTPRNDVLFMIGDWNAKVEVKRYCDNRQVWSWSTK